MKLKVIRPEEVMMRGHLRSGIFWAVEEVGGARWEVNASAGETKTRRVGLIRLTAHTSVQALLAPTCIVWPPLPVLHTAFTHCPFYQGSPLMTILSCPTHFYPPPMPAGTGRTGMYRVPPNNYPFYSEEERYVPVIQADGGQLSGVEGWKENAAIYWV